MPVFWLRAATLHFSRGQIPPVGRTLCLQVGWGGATTRRGSCLCCTVHAASSTHQCCACRRHRLQGTQGGWLMGLEVGSLAATHREGQAASEVGKDRTTAAPILG